MSTLYQLAAEYADAFDVVQYNEETGEIEGWQQLEAINADFEAKAEATACWIKNTIAEAEAIAAEIAGLQKRLKAKQRKVEWGKGYLAAAMQTVGREQFETARCYLSFRRSTQVKITDESLLPPDFVNKTMVQKPSKEQIKKALLAGQTVPGAELEHKQNLQIK